MIVLNIPNLKWPSQQKRFITGLHGKYFGAGMTEYAVITSFVLLACVVPFQSTASGFRTLLSQVFASPGSTSSSASRNPSAPVLPGGGTLVSPPQESTLPFDLPTPPSPVEPGNPQLPNGVGVITLGNGTQLELSKIPKNSGSYLVETAGISGYTKAYLSVLDELITQLSSKPEALGNKPASIQNLVELSNKGHELAYLQQLVEAEAATAYSYSELNWRQVSFQNESISVNRLSELIDTSGFNMHRADPKQYTPETLMNYSSNDIRFSDSLTNEFISLYKNAVNSGVLDDPALRGLVDQITFNLAYMTDTVGNVIRVDNETLNPRQLKQQAASAFTTTRATDICVMGNGVNVGNACQVR
jgi:hypothetical protein